MCALKPCQINKKALSLVPAEDIIPAGCLAI